MSSLVFRPLGLLVIVLAAGIAVAAETASRPPATAPAALVERGRYLARIAGCNDCHTAGYAERAGDVPEKDWLTGDSLGWRGPWGTTYPIDLRLYMNGMTEQQWLATARAARSRPPMPWFALRDMSDEDLRALYHFVRALGPGGKPAPAFVPPGEEPRTPCVSFPAPPK